MIYYPISTLMLAGIREILIITTPQDNSNFRELLGDGSDFGVSFEYAVQQEPRGLADAFIIGADFLAGESSLMILGDNIFHGAGLGSDLERTIPNKGCHIYTYKVANPSDYGILTFGDDGTPLSICEKPMNSKSNHAVTGLYFFDSRASKFAQEIIPSNRGELEITSLIEKYLDINELSVTQLTRGAAWLDTGKPSSLNDASTFVRVIEERTGLKIACLEEIAFDKGWIDKSKVLLAVEKMKASEYGNYLAKTID
jgi:glucose-1-phosphate thymidylyltransferase